MSTVRMCDNPQCAEIFSELEEGWTTSNQTKVVTNERGYRSTVQINVDLCPDCSGDTEGLARKLSEGRRERRRARLELEGSPSYRLAEKLQRSSTYGRVPQGEEDDPEDEHPGSETESYKRMVGRPGYTAG